MNWKTKKKKNKKMIKKTCRRAGEREDGGRVPYPDDRGRTLPEECHQPPVVAIVRRRSRRSRRRHRRHRRSRRRRRRQKSSGGTG